MDMKTVKNSFFGLVDPESEPFELMIKHLELVIEANQQTNITSINNLKEAVYLHAYDSLLGLAWLEDAEQGLFADIGSGAGFPGIPLALFSGRRGALIEATKKKALLLNSFLDELGLSEAVSVIPLRAQQVARQQKTMYTAITARAVSSLAALMELASPLLQINGILIAYKGPAIKTELDKAKDLEELLGMKIETIGEYQLPTVDARRSLVIIRKAAEAKITLPRADGRAQKRPMG